MYKYLFQLTLFRFGVKKFQNELNEHLEDGWQVEKFEIHRVGFFRVLLFANLHKPGVVIRD